MLKKEIISLFPRRLSVFFEALNEAQYEKMQEIRLRIGQPIGIKIDGVSCYLDEAGICSYKPKCHYAIRKEDLDETLKIMSGFSLYALEEELRQGYLTLIGGHRVGLTGKTVVEKGRIKTLKHINSMNIRIAHEKLGCSEIVMPYIVGRNRVYHTLIVSPPGCGKTTLLRDVIRSLSEGFSGYGPYTVGVVDERSELAACYQGIPQNHMGCWTDVLDACPKVEGMLMLLRTMAPDIIAVDEIGTVEDMKAIEAILTAGVSVIATVHGKDVEDCYRRPVLRDIIEEGLFERIIVLSHLQGPCTIEGIYEGKRRLY